MNRPCDHADHCPFVNRRDARCAAHLRIDGMSHAFGFCFDDYTKCPVYFDQLMERRARRAQEAQRHAALTGIHPTAAATSVAPALAGQQPAVVQVTIIRRVCSAFARSASHANAA